MIKEIRVRPLYDDVDYEHSLNNAIRFLDKNEQIKLIVVFKAREISHPELGERILLKFVEDLKDYAKTEWPPIRESRQIFMIFTPKTVG